MAIMIAKNYKKNKLKVASEYAGHRVVVEAEVDDLGRLQETIKYENKETERFCLPHSIIKNFDSPVDYWAEEYKKSYKSLGGYGLI